MIHHHPPQIPLQNFLCLDCGAKKTGIANNFAMNSIAFPHLVCETNLLEREIFSIIEKDSFDYIVSGLPFAYPESPSYSFIITLIDGLQKKMPNMNFIFWDETSSSQEIREAYKFGRKGFSKKFYQGYDAKSASLILQSFLLSNF